MKKLLPHVWRTKLFGKPPSSQDVTFVMETDQNAEALYQREYVIQSYRRNCPLIVQKPELFCSMFEDIHREDEKHDFAMLRVAVGFSKSLLLESKYAAVIPAEILIFCLEDVSVWDAVLTGWPAYHSDDFQDKQPLVYKFIAMLQDMGVDGQLACSLYQNNMHLKSAIMPQIPPDGFGVTEAVLA